jgi:hypothetical protein
MAVSTLMRTLSTPPVLAAKHALRRRAPSLRPGPVAAALALVAACALLGAGAVHAGATPGRHQMAIAEAATHPHKGHHPSAGDHAHDGKVSAADPHSKGGAGTSSKGAAVMRVPGEQAAVAPTAQPAAAAAAASPPAHLTPLRVVVLGPQAPAAPAATGAAVPAPGSAPQHTSAPTGAGGVQSPGPGVLPPVALLPSPAQSSVSQPSVLPAALLAAFLAILLIATVVTARRRS